jgi:hypothetical protein
MTFTITPALAETPAGRVTLDLTGNVIDATGTIVAFVVGGPAAAGGLDRITVDRKGKVADKSGKQIGRLIIGASDTFNEIAKVTVDADGNVIDREGKVFAHIVFGGSDGRSAPKVVRLNAGAVMLDNAGSKVGQAAVVRQGGFIDRKGQLEAQLARDLSDRKLTSVQYDRLSNDIEDAARDEQQYTKDGVLSAGEEQKLLVKLDKVQEKARRALALTGGR